MKRLLLPLPGTKEEKDISDYFKAGNTREEERVAFCWQLLQPEAVVFAEAAAIEAAGRGERAVQLDRCV